MGGRVIPPGSEEPPMKERLRLPPGTALEWAQDIVCLAVVLATVAVSIILAAGFGG